MIQVIGRQEQQAIDRLWQARTGLPLLLLMEAAAWAVSRACLELLGESGRVLVLAGKGQNGGDALACARQLSASGIQVICREVFPDSELPTEADANRAAARSMGLGLGPLKEADFQGLDSGSLIVDGIFGTGYQAARPLPPAVARISEMIAAARRQGARVVAIDVPTGLDADSGAAAESMIQADCTVTFIRPKIGLCAAPGRFLAGRVVTSPIGVPDAWVDEAIQAVADRTGYPYHYQIELADVKACRPVRPADSHKGTFGKALLLGGSPGIAGAILLAAESAARSGTGLVYLGVPASVGPLILAARPEFLVNLVPDDAEADSSALISRLLAGQPAVAAGPGGGQAAWLQTALPQLIREASQLVLDADALNTLAGDPGKYLKLLCDRVSRFNLPPAILTPHPGEFRRLAPDLDLSDRQQAALELARRSSSIVILKGASTVVADPAGQIWINPTGHDGLARGGSGDVLCGLLAGLLAQGLQPVAAALCGVFLHGLAAEAAAERLSRRTMLPGDLIDSLGEAFRRAGWDTV